MFKRLKRLFIADPVVETKNESEQFFSDATLKKIKKTSRAIQEKCPDMPLQMCTRIARMLYLQHALNIINDASQLTWEDLKLDTKYKAGYDTTVNHFLKYGDKIKSRLQRRRHGFSEVDYMELLESFEDLTLCFIDLFAELPPFNWMYIDADESPDLAEHLDGLEESDDAPETVEEPEDGVDRIDRIIDHVAQQELDEVDLIDESEFDDDLVTSSGPIEIGDVTITDDDRQHVEDEIPDRVEALTDRYSNTPETVTPVAEVANESAFKSSGFGSGFSDEAKDFGGSGFSSGGDSGGSSFDSGGSDSGGGCDD